MQLLLDQQVDVNVPDTTGATPLLLAVQQGAAALVSDLLGAGADTNRAGPNGTTPLLAALQPAGNATSDLALVEELVSRGANVNARDNAGLSPLGAALARGDEEAAMLLLDAGAARGVLAPQQEAELAALLPGGAAPAPALEAAAHAPELLAGLLPPSVEETMPAGGMEGGPLAPGEEALAARGPAPELLGMAPMVEAGQPGFEGPEMLGARLPAGPLEAAAPALEGLPEMALAGAPLAEGSLVG